MAMWGTKPKMVTADEALPGRMSYTYSVPAEHAVLEGASLEAPWPSGSEIAVFGMGCFWGVERIFWQLPGVLSTSAGYAGGSCSVRRRPTSSTPTATTSRPTRTGWTRRIWSTGSAALSSA